MEEIMRALNDVVESGKVRYIGASTVSPKLSCKIFLCLRAMLLKERTDHNQMPAWEFQMLQNVADKHGWHKFISMQNYYNLLYREEGILEALFFPRFLIQL